MKSGPGTDETGQATESGQPGDDIHGDDLDSIDASTDGSTTTRRSPTP